MPFQNKDLHATLLPKAGITAADIAKICLFRTSICRWPTFCFHGTCLNWISHCGHCSFLGTIVGCGIIHSGGCGILNSGGGCGILNSCGAGGSACDPTVFCAGTDPYVIQDLEDLVTLRGELQQTLARLDEIERAGLPSGIQTRAEADALEKSLSEALEHVRRQREGLK